MRIVIVGGGVAGLAAACALSARGDDVTLVEREQHFCSHSSGRNAAMYRPLEARQAVVQLAARTAVLLDDIFDGERRRWLDPCGMLLTAETEALLAKQHDVARSHDVPVRAMAGAELARRVPHAPGLAGAFGLLLRDGGVIDVHAVCQQLEMRARAAGAVLRRGAEVTDLLAAPPGVHGVRLGSGDTLPADLVVLAAGAWSRDLAARVDAELPLVPHRRHLVQLVPARATARCPIVWHAGPETYFRNEGTGVLASPCDHEPHAPGLPHTDERMLHQLGQRLGPLSAELAAARVRTAWACLRTMSPDGNMVVGRDPRIAGLAWLSGLAGHGMSAATAAGELLADVVHGLDSALARELGVERYLAEAVERSAPAAP